MVSDLNDPTVERLAARLHHQSPLRSGVADNGKAGDGHLRRFRKIALGFALCVLDTRPCGRRCTHRPRPRRTGLPDLRQMNTMIDPMIGKYSALPKKPILFSINMQFAHSRHGHQKSTRGCAAQVCRRAEGSGGRPHRFQSEHCFADGPGCARQIRCADRTYPCARPKDWGQSRIPNSLTTTR